MSADYEKSPQDHLYENRIIYMSGDIVTTTADYVVSRLLILDSIDHDAEIKLYISSFGGSVYAGLAIYDAMQLVEAPVSTYCIGPAFSMAAWILAAGEPGRRSATPNSRIMLHQASAGLVGSTTDIKIAAENVIKNQALMVDLLRRHTARPVDEIARMIERDLWMTPEEALDFGLIDFVTTPCERKRRNGLDVGSKAQVVSGGMGIVDRARAG
ncbi:MAG: ATP-dependent Clp protease proteolytic subunit [Deltaproteobacteria bacterium]|nr:ATP-dependent Clp protease proteolytic subunit [Deltaproteobacteria bacterium]